MVRNFDARIHQKTTLQIQTYNTKTATTFTLSLRAQDLWKLAQDPIATDNSPPAGQERITNVQKVVGSILYYTRLVDSTPLVALNTLASEHAHATEKMIKT